MFDTIDEPVALRQADADTGLSASDEWPHGYGMCHCGCGKRTTLAKANLRSRGWRKGEPIRFCQGHNRTGEDAPLEPRFWALVDRRGPDECWPFIGSRNPQTGYGRMRIRGRFRQATHVALEVHGIAVPRGMVACHRCDNPPCVNPAHLFVGTKGDNYFDSIAKGRAVPLQDRPRRSLVPS